ncbi:hypothetical protein I7I51_05700 [Histoplasma capsulatum]|uniref:Uncharacterized protein n=1 Tax=Ajellomyces capsulatus TaxID=5037 RepID=A0A8A1M5H1_AJECA|nr:hypothetical protein I7I51_05700 [Histoplasma capsulatum]
MAPLTSQDLRTNVSALAQKLDSPNIDYVIMKSASTYLQGVDPNRKQAADIRDIINMIPLAVPGRQELDFNRSHDCKRFAMSRCRLEKAPILFFALEESAEHDII